jgi:asparagine synthase (glutamine-hydrolysing)
MSAIFGILRFDGEAAAARDLDRMSNTLRHRGPDGRKFAIDGQAGVGHCLMRVNQEDIFEAQPIRDRESGLILAADCRIDNREQLAEQFRIGATELRDMPDSALVLRAYKMWGEDCAEHLLGDFAFAVWDPRAGRLVLGRDHMGQRNVFYHKGENFLAFATELRALWALADVPRHLLDDEIARYFYRQRGTVTTGSTLYAGIYGLPGGTVLAAAADGAVELRRYWEPRADPAHEGRDESYYVEKYRAILTEAVACRLRRLTGPAALLNSAGFDTAAIAGLAGPVVAAKNRKLISLTSLGADPDLPVHGDIRPWLEACRRVMPHLDVRTVTFEVESPLAGIERAFSIHDAPAGGNGKTSRRLYGEAAAAGARLVMDGFGGDYTLNPRGYGALACHLRRGRFRRFVAEARAHRREAGASYWSYWRMLKGDVVLPLLPRWLIRWQRYVRQAGARAWRIAALRELEGAHVRKLRTRIAARGRPAIESIPPAAMREGIRCTAAMVCSGSIAGGAATAAALGLDLTRPFHDKRVVELGLAIPEDLYVKNGKTRYLARRALVDLYPPEFQSRGRKNVGALSDSAIWDLSATDLLAEADRLKTSPRLSRYFDFERAHQYLAEPEQSGPPAHKKSAAVRAILTSRFIEWVTRENMP